MHGACSTLLGCGQDTNALIWHVLPATLGMSAAHALDFNSVCVPRTPGEAVSPPYPLGPRVCRYVPHGVRRRWLHDRVSLACTMEAVPSTTTCLCPTAHRVGLFGASRKAKRTSALEQVGALCKLVRPMADGSVNEMTLNVEYNQLDSVRPQLAS